MPLHNRAARIGVALAAATLAGLAPPAQAQPQAPAADGTYALPELRVEEQGETATGPVQGYVARRSATGTKTDTPLIETPQAVSVITRDRLDAQNVRTVGEALRYSAGVSGEAFGPDVRGEYLNIRGFNADIYLDGMRLPVPTATNAFRLEPWGLERLEVLRGAASALYGQGNLGGIINAVSKVPRADQVNQVNLQAGSFGRIQGALDVGGAVGQDGKLLWRFNGLLRDADTPIDGQRINRVYLAPSLTWRPTGDTTITVLGSYLYDDLGSVGQFLPPAGTVLPNRNGRIRRDINSGDPIGFDRYQKEQFSIGYLAEHRPNAAWTLRQNVRFTHHSIDAAIAFPTSLAANQRIAGRTASVSQPVFNAVTIDNQAETRFATGPLEHTLLGGLDYRLVHANNRSFTAAATPLDLFAPSYGTGIAAPPRNGRGVSSNNQAQNQLGLYLQDQVSLDRWRLTLTGRHDWADTSTANNVTGANTSQRDSAFTGRAALLYASEIGLSPYVSYATSFLPTLGTLAPARGGGTLQPSTGEQVEVGLKYQPPGSRSLATATLFELTQTNVSVADPQNPLFSIQTGEVRVRGFEFEAVGNLTRNLNLIGAYTYQEPEVTKSTIAANVGQRPVAVPNHLASLWADWSWPVTEELTVGLGGGVRYVGNTAGDPANAYSVPSYTLVDATARADWRQWRLQVNGTNLGDKTFVAGCSGGFNCAYGFGRAVYASLGYRW